MEDPPVPGLLFINTSGANEETPAEQHEEIRCSYLKMAELQRMQMQPQIKLYRTEELEDCQKSDDDERDVEWSPTPRYLPKIRVKKRIKTTINIGSAFTRWCRLKEVKKLKSHAQVATLLLNRYDQTEAVTSRTMKKKRNSRVTPLPVLLDSAAEILVNIGPGGEMFSTPATVPVSTAASEGLPMKRKRGRPRNTTPSWMVSTSDPLVMEPTLFISSSNTASDGAPVKRKRGRPRKDATKPAATFTSTVTGDVLISPQDVILPPGEEEGEWTKVIISDEDVSRGGNDSDWAYSDWSKHIASDAEDGSSKDSDWGQDLFSDDDDQFSSGDADSDWGESRRGRRREVKQPLQCEVCGKACIGQSALNTHRRVHTGEKPFQCRVCGKAFKHKVTLVKHVRLHPEDQSYLSDLAKQSEIGTQGADNSGQDLNKMEDGTTGEEVENSLTRDGEDIFTADSSRKGKKKLNQYKKTFHCKECGLACPSHAHLVIHTRVHTGERPYQCESCDKSFKTKFHLGDHNRRVHLGMKPYQCDICDRVFSREKALTVHRLNAHTITPTYKCQDCDQFFSKKGEYSQHRKTHTGETTYLCDNCGKSFRTQNHLAVHSRIHTGEKPYQCEVCGEGFRYKITLDTHRRVHTGEKEGPVHTAEKPFLCEECGKSYKSRAEMLVHRRTHTGEKPFQCDLCGKGFKSKSHLVAHTRVHTGEKPINCQYCDKAFRDRGKLNVHIRIHTGEKPYLCNLCGKAFRAKFTLVLHTRNHMKKLQQEGNLTERFPPITTM